MKYIKPTYKNEALDTGDIILASLGAQPSASLTEVNSSTAQLSASVLDVLGLRR